MIIRKDFRKGGIAAVLILALAGCSTAQLANTQATIATATPIAQTLADMAAADSHTVATLLAGGAAICKKTNGYVALAQTVGGLTTYASVVNAVAADVATACAIAGGVPAPLPATVPAATVPVVVLPPTAALKPAA